MTDYEMKKLAKFIFELIKEEQIKASQEEKWLTPKEAAEMIGWTTSTFYNRRNLFATNGKSGKAKRYSKLCITRFLQNER